MITNYCESMATNIFPNYHPCGKRPHSGFSPSGQASAHALCSGRIRQGHHWPAPAIPPSGESRQSYTSRTIEINAFWLETVVFRKQLRVQCVKTANNLLMWGRYPPINTSLHSLIHDQVLVQMKQFYAIVLTSLTTLLSTGHCSTCCIAVLGSLQCDPLKH
jgi:hypothetical protein